MLRYFLGLVGAGVLCGCPGRNPDVCCTTVETCASIGVDPDRVEEFSRCEDGKVCVGTMCVDQTVNDAATRDAPIDGPSTRCDPSEEFATFELVPGGLNSERTEIVGLSLSHDELVAYVDVQELEARLNSAVRESAMDDFPTPSTPAELDDILDETGRELNAWISPNGLDLYFERNGIVKVSTRLDTNAVFSSGEPVTSGGNEVSKLAQMSADAQTLYFFDGNGYLQSAERGSALGSFLFAESASTFMVFNGRVSADELELYYVSGATVRRSIRGTKRNMFQPGVVIPSFPAVADVHYLTADDCLMYYRGSDGQLYLARRGIAN